MEKGYTFQSNKKGVIPVVNVKPYSGDWLEGARLTAQGDLAKVGKVTFHKKDFFADPEEARKALIAHHDKALQTHEENAKKSRANLQKVHSQKIQSVSD